MGKKHFQTAETGKRTPNSSVKGSDANHYPIGPPTVQQMSCDLVAEVLGGHHSISRGGGGAGVFVADKLFISTGLGGALKISNLSHVYIEQFLK